MYTFRYCLNLVCQYTPDTSQKALFKKRVKILFLDCLFRPFAKLIQKKYLDHSPSKKIFKQRLLIKIDVFTRSNKCVIIKENSDEVKL